MAKQWEKQVGRFAATDEQGREYWIHVSQKVHDVGTQMEPSVPFGLLAHWIRYPVRG
jgi:hypothetical protein